MRGNQNMSAKIFLVEFNQTANKHAMLKKKRLFTHPLVLNFDEFDKLVLLQKRFIKV